jgi:N-acetylneuraminate synthase
MKQVYIIAEVGNTHEGSLGLARRFVRAAAECGVDAVKFQTHLFDAESLPDAPAPAHFTDESRREYFERTAFDVGQWHALKAFTEELGADFLSSAFSLEAVDLLEDIGVSAHKIPSGEVTNLPLLEHVAETGKKVLLSSGMSTWAELDRAVETLRSGGCEDLVVMQCTSAYPCPPEEAGLNVLAELQEKYGAPVGYSDHTLGPAVAVAAVTLGATVVEKHFTLSKLMYGSDAAHSTEPDDFKHYVACLRDAAKALAHPVDKDQKAATLGTMKTTFEKSIVAASDLEEGAVICEQDLAFKKPGTGLSAAVYRKLLGRRLKSGVTRDHLFAWEDFLDEETRQ